MIASRTRKIASFAAIRRASRLPLPPRNRKRSPRQAVAPQAERSGSSSGAGLGPFGLGRQFFDLQRIDAPAVGADHPEAEVADRRRFAAFGKAAEALEDQPADGVKLLVAEVAFESFVEVADLGLRLDAKAPVRLGDDIVLGFVEIVLVLDVADDLLEHVLD